MSEPKRHHWVPRSYLRRFAESDRVAVRHRTRGLDPARSTEKVAAENGLYKVPGQPLTAEATLERIESAALPCFEQLQAGGLPRAGTDSRHALAVFMGIQLNRAPTAHTISRFDSSLRLRFGEPPFEEYQVRGYLTDQYGFEPDDAEVRAATSQANAVPADDRSATRKRSDELNLMFEIALGMAPFLEAHSWSLEVSKASSLVTSDRPVVLWNPERPEDKFEGVGLMDAQEKWLLLDGHRMLVLRTSGPERIRTIGPERVDFVNRHIARHCSSEIFAPPSEAHLLEQLPLSRFRPLIRFASGALQNGPEGAEILHCWHPIRDVPEDDVPA